MLEMPGVCWKFPVLSILVSNFATRLMSISFLVSLIIRCAPKCLVFSVKLN